MTQVDFRQRPHGRESHGGGGYPSDGHDRSSHRQLEKGGIGKTTPAANLAVAWGLAGRRVLAVDLDPQFAMTRRFDHNPAETLSFVAAALLEQVVTIGLGEALAEGKISGATGPRPAGRRVSEEGGSDALATWAD